MRATSLDGHLAVAAGGLDRQLQRARAADVVERAVDRLAVAQDDLRGAGELGPVGVGHRPPVKSITDTSFWAIVPIGAVDPHRVADAAEIDELSADLLAVAQGQRGRFLRVGGAREEQGRGAERAENRPFQPCFSSPSQNPIDELSLKSARRSTADCKGWAKIGLYNPGVRSAVSGQWTQGDGAGATHCTPGVGLVLVSRRIGRRDARAGPACRTGSST